MDIVFCKNIDSLEEYKFVNSFIIECEPEVSVIGLGRGILSDKKRKDALCEEEEIIEQKKILQYDILISDIFYVYKDNEKIIKSNYIGKMYVSGLDLCKLIHEIEEFKYKVLNLDNFSKIISISTSDFYYNLYDEVGQKVSMEFLKAVRDANTVGADCIALQREYLELIASTMRFGEEELYDSKKKAFTKERLDYIIGESSQFIENIKSDISLFTEDKDMSWELYIDNNISINYFHNKGDEYYNDKIIGALIGANGVGKSSTLRSIAKTCQEDFKFIYLVPSIREELKDKDDKFYHSEDLEYNILREHADNIKNNLRYYRYLHNAIIRAVSVLEKDKLFEMTGFVEYFRKTSISDSGIEYSKLSSGQINIIHLILYFLDNVLENYEKLRDLENGNNFLLLIDEPENALHPPLLATYLRILYSILKIFNGCALIATHSPTLIQELTSNLVLIVSREVGEAPTFCNPDIETYGENIGILTDRIFGRDPLNTGFRQTLKDIVNSLPKNELFSPEVREKYIYSQIGVTSLGMEASMVLNGLISSRRKNIELKEKNSEDSL